MSTPRTLLLALALVLSGSARAQDLPRMLAGELSNSAATCTADIDHVMPRMKALGLNTVLVPAQWDLIEPSEGHFDFSLIDRTIAQAQANDLHVVFLWFGAWKNSMSCYAPLWFKENTRKYPRALTADGKPLEIASAFSADVLAADTRAFTRLAAHIAQTDTAGRVIMLQVENEIGMLEAARDHSAAANRLFAAPVPRDLLDFLLKNDASLHPWLKARLQSTLADYRRTLRGTPTWSALFGSDLYADEIFMAYHYARYVEHLAVAAREAGCRLPLYVNAALNSRGRKPGEYPAAGPLAHLIDVWHCAAPHILCLAPDIYDTGFKSWCEQYALPNNPLFIPETRCQRDCGARAFYAFGEYRALGFSPFAIDQAPASVAAHVTQAYRLLSALRPLLDKKDAQTWGLLFDQQDTERVIADGDVRITSRHYFTLPWDGRATDGSTWPEGGALVLKLADKDYLIAGTGVVLSFQTASEQEQTQQKTLGEDGFALQGQASSAHTQSTAFRGHRLGIGYVDEVDITPDGSLRYLRRENGDQSHQGRHARISVDEYKILHVKLYEY